MIYSKFFRFQYLLFSILVFTSLQAAAQPVAANVTDPSGLKQGPWVVHFEDGGIHYSGAFKDNIPVGEFRYFYPDGKLKAVVEFQGANNVAMAKTYFDSEENNLMAEGKYINQKKDSVWVYYFPSGQVATRESYKNNERHGESKVFYEEGGVSEIAQYKDGVKNGTWQQFFPNGTIKLEATVVDGLFYEGDYTEYYPDGTKSTTGKYVDGKKTGSWWHFHEDGSPEIVYVYSNGEILEEHPQNGTFKNYFNDDILKSEFTYKNGKKQGPFKEYYHKGDWITETAVDQFGNERQVQRLHNTQIKREGSYKDGVLDGKVSYYKEDGAPEKTEIYQMGELIDSSGAR